MEYDGPRDAVGIADWLRKREQPVVSELEASQVESFLEKLGTAYGVVAYVKKKSARHTVES